MSNLQETLKSRWFLLGLHAGLWLVLLLLLTRGGLSRRTTPFQEARTQPATAIPPVPVTPLQILFTATNYTEQVLFPGLPSPFMTRHFIPATPPPAQPPPAAPPPPTTWKLELAYQGFYRTGEGPKYALLRLGEELVSVPVGGRVTTNVFVLDATLKTLTLTNTAAQTNVLGLNKKQIIEVPLK